MTGGDIGDCGARQGGVYLISGSAMNVSGGEISNNKVSDVRATGGKYGSGIGVGYHGAVSNITINGGTVTASGDLGSIGGIGCGRDGTCSGVYVADGLVLKAGPSANPTEVIPHKSPTKPLVPSTNFNGTTWLQCTTNFPAAGWQDVESGRYIDGKGVFLRCLIDFEHTQEQPGGFPMEPTGTKTLKVLAH